jgi:RNA polymerase sigma factor (sigma-70 family)
MKPDPDEYTLALRARAGDRDALALLVERTRLRLFALAYAELRHYDDAHDAVAAALLQVCLHVGELRQPARVREWMQSIVRNEARRLRRGPARDDLPLEEADAAADNTRATLLRLDIERALCRLPSDQAEVSRLFYLDDLTIAEIAHRTGRPPGTIKSWLHRGRQRLATELEEYEPMKRREALKLLAATPVVATTLEEGMADPSPKTPAPAPDPVPRPVAAILHTHLEPALLQQLTEVLSASGYDPRVITPTEQSLTFVESLVGSEVIILDEWIGSRASFELLLNIRGNAVTREMPVVQLCAEPSPFTSVAYFAAGASRLVDKTDPKAIAALEGRIERPIPSLWSLFTERARRVIFFAQEEAARLGVNFVGTEHLLLGLTRVPDSAGALVLARLGIPLDRVQEEVGKHVTPGAGTRGKDIQLTPYGKVVIDLAYDEAKQLRNNYIGVEHLLLGLVREGEGLAAQILTQLGADLARTRAEIQRMQEG